MILVLLTVHAGGMEYFATEEELQNYLQHLHKDYGNLYAERLWSHGVTASSVLAANSVEALMRAGVTAELHAGHIRAKAGMPGEVEAMLLAAPLPRPNLDMHFVLAVSHICFRCHASARVQQGVEFMVKQSPSSAS